MHVLKLSGRKLYNLSIRGEEIYVFDYSKEYADKYKTN